MRHDSKYSQSHLSAVRQRPDGSIVMGQQYNKDYHRKHSHRDNEDYNNNNNYYRYNKERYYGSHSNSDSQNGERGSSSSSSNSGSSGDNGGVVSALSVTHESEKQWEWLEEVLAKSHRNKETVSLWNAQILCYYCPPFFAFQLPVRRCLGHTRSLGKWNFRFMGLSMRNVSIWMTKEGRKEGTQWSQENFENLMLLKWGKSSSKQKRNGRFIWKICKIYLKEEFRDWQKIREKVFLFALVFNRPFAANF
jgi:hypothetical protein